MELFDQVKAAPPPDRIRETKPPTEVENGGRDGDDDDDEDDDMKDIRMPSPIAASPSPDFTLDKHINKHKETEKTKGNAPELRECEEEPNGDGGPEGSLKTLKRKISQDTIMVDQLLTDKDKTEIKAESETELEDQPQQHSPPKTKAEQKMFIDHQPESTKSSVIVSLKSNPITTTSIRKCRVRIKRLSKREIVLHTRSSGSNGNQRKRGRPRKSEEEEDDVDSDLPSPSKKSKIIPRVHVKIPWLQNGSKQSALKKLTRGHTPPPSKLKRLAKGKGVGKNRPTASPALIKRYGKRFFGCVVKLKRCPMPWTVHVATPSNNNSNSTKRRSRKSNLSVSFSEAVEIFGSNESGTRRSTLGSGRTPRKDSVSVPTRLQRVDATGNILEDISLMSNTPLCGPSSSKRARRASSGNKTSETCNGGGSSSRKFKRSSLRVPVTGLASLHLGNKQNSMMETADGSDADDDEYIVPNELPGIHRAGTPIARMMRKRVTITTTTISDDDDDEVEDKEGGGERGGVNSVLLPQKTEYKNLKEKNQEEKKEEEMVKVEQTKEQKAKEEEKKVNKEKTQEEEQKEIKKKEAVEKEKRKEVEKAEEVEKTKQKEAEDNTKEKIEITKKITVEEDKSEENEKAKKIDKAKEDEKEEEEIEVSENTNEKKEKEQREDRKEKEEANEEEKEETEGKKIKEEKEEEIEEETEEKDAKEEQQKTEEKSTMQEKSNENVEKKLEERKEDKTNEEEEEEEEMQQELMQLSEIDKKEIKKNESETTKYNTDKIESKDANEKTIEDIEAEEASNDGVSTMEPLLVRQTDISIKEDDETDGHKNEPSAKDKETKKTNMESSKAKSTQLYFLNSTKQEDPDDILEIETSLDDVRDLHTPLSNNSRCSTPQSKDLTKKILQPLRSRLDSGDSDSSFKSATEMHIPASTITKTLSSISNDPIATNTTAISQLNKSPAATLTENSEPQGSSTVSIPTPPFSGIGVIPNLDDLEQLTEPNFQLSNSRHLDDIIMTELES